MSDVLTNRLNKILPEITSPKFLSSHGLGNEIAFYIFDYPPEEELRVREHVEFLLKHIPKQRPGLAVAHVNLFEFLVDYLKRKGRLDKAFEKQRDEGDAALLKALKGTLQEQKVAREFERVVNPKQCDIVLISGVGSAYPMLRSHTLLNNLHAIMGQTPLVMFYPGKYDKLSLRLFGKTGLAGGTPEERKRKANYYRAFRLIE